MIQFVKQPGCIYGSWWAGGGRTGFLVLVWIRRVEELCETVNHSSRSCTYELRHESKKVCVCVCVYLCVCLLRRGRIRARFCSSHFMSACRSFRMRCCLCLCGVSVCVCVCVRERERERKREWMNVWASLQQSLCFCSFHVCVCVCVSEQVRPIVVWQNKKAFNSVGNNNYNHVYLRLEWL